MNQSRRPKGAPGGTGGQYSTTPAGAGSPPDRDMRAAQAAATADRIEQAAARGENATALDMARRAGFFCPGDKPPYGDGAIACFDGRHVFTADKYGPQLIARDYFDPYSLG